MHGSKYDPLDNEKTLHNTSSDQGEASVGDLRTLGGDAVGGEQSVGDLPTEAPSGGEARPAEGFEGVELSERYEIIGEIGRGGFAVVYKARDKRLRREVVVKRLHFGEAGMGDETIRRRFEHEAHAIAALNHPNIIQVYDYDRDAEGHYIVMEYVPDGSLRDLLKAKGKLEDKEAVRIIRQVCQGLAFAHRKNLVHRDVKPANILMQGGNAKIADFGLARAGFETGMSMSLSMSGTGMGTPYYMPPEQREDAKKVNHTADIYAVAKTLYQLVTGDIPDNVDPDLIPSPELAKIIFKCVKTRPEDRYFSMEELIKALDGVGAPKPKAQSPEPAGGNACPKCGRGCSDTELFCGGCGENLARDCPECGVKNSRFRRFCNGCGTDIEGFGQVAEVKRKVEQAVKGKRWKEAVGEAGKLNTDTRLPGDKGRGLKKEITAGKNEAGEMLRNIRRLEVLLAECESAPPSKSLDKEVERLTQWVGRFEELAAMQPLTTQQEQTKREVEQRVKKGRAEVLRQAAETARRQKLGKVKAVSAIVALLVGFVLIGVWIEKSYTSPARRVAASATAQPARTEPARQTPAVARIGEAVRKRLSPGQDIAIDLGGGQAMEFVWIPALKGWAGKFEVTNGEYRRFKPSHDSRSYEGHSLNHDRQPAVYVSWNDAQEFIRWMRANCELPQGYMLTLPSATEWMTVVQCGDGRTYPWGNEWPPPSGRAGNYHGQEGAGSWGKISGYRDDFPVTAQVDRLWRNPWGLYGVGGNVWEWTEEKDGSLYVLRGASWGSRSQDSLRCVGRYGYGATGQNDGIGFRLFLRP